MSRHGLWRFDTILHISFILGWQGRYTVLDRYWVNDANYIDGSSICWCEVLPMLWSDRIVSWPWDLRASYQLELLVELIYKRGIVSTWVNIIFRCHLQAIIGTTSHSTSHGQVKQRVLSLNEYSRATYLNYGSI